MPHLPYFVELAEVAQNKSVALSSSSVTLLRCALEYVQSLNNWSGYGVELTTEEIEAIQDIVDSCILEIDQEIEPVATSGIAKLVRQYASGTAGGTSVANAWTNFPAALTKKVDTDNIVWVMESDNAWINPGKYKMTLTAQFVATGGAVLQVRTRLQIAGFPVGAYPVSETFSLYLSNQNQVTLCDVVEIIGDPVQIYPQYYCSVARATNGLGTPYAAPGIPEIYETWLIERVG